MLEEYDFSDGVSGKHYKQYRKGNVDIAVKIRSGLVGRLLLSKRLYTVGLGYSEADDSISAGLAISIFQDSVELLCNSILQELDPKASKDTRFDQFYKLILEAPHNENKIKLSHWSKMRALNKARVGFKHYGNLPDVTQAREYQRYTEDFLRDSFSDFFNEDFDVFSLSELIPFKDVRSHVKEAEKFLLEEEVKDCLIQLAIAKNLLSERFLDYFPHLDNEFV